MGWMCEWENVLWPEWKDDGKANTSHAEICWLFFLCAWPRSCPRQCLIALIIARWNHAPDRIRVDVWEIAFLVFSFFCSPRLMQQWLCYSHAHKDHVPATGREIMERNVDPWDLRDQPSYQITGKKNKLATFLDPLHSRDLFDPPHLPRMYGWYNKQM